MIEEVFYFSGAAVWVTRPRKPSRLLKNSFWPQMALARKVAGTTLFLFYQAIPYHPREGRIEAVVQSP